MEKTKENIKTIFPLIALRGLTVFPSTIISFEVGREKSRLALDEAMKNDQYIFLVSQKTSDIEFPTEKDIYKTGTICKIKQTLKIKDDNVKVLVEGISRAQIKSFDSSGNFFTVEVQEVFDRPIKNFKNVEALMEMINEELDTFNKESRRNAEDFFELKIDSSNPYIYSDVIASYINFKPSIMQELLEELNVEKRLNKIYLAIREELSILEIKKRVENRVNKQISKNQREYYLREQIKAIQRELGEDESIFEEINDFKNKLLSLNLNDVVKNKLEKEISKLSKMSSSSAEATVSRNYIETILSLPWNLKTIDNDDIKKSIKILENEHFGLEKIKERIVEFLAIRQLNNNMKSPILCLVGPPGVGKTSIAKSIANAMNRKFVRISLGGIRDEAEIRGHRRTYIGAIPGRIINAIKEVNVNNPVFLLDEIDKMTSDFRGDPASAMLEVLDPEQNKDFIDHYLEVPFDLSNSVFITTANSLSTIPRPLLDRMEIINLSGYTDLEKVQISKRYLINKQEIENGLSKNFIKISDELILYIVNNYTRESGVRKLEQQIGKICRKVAVDKVKNPKLKSKKITLKLVKEYLGKEIFRSNPDVKNNKVGEVTGLAWTQVGGETLSIEVSVVEGNGKIELTGQLGDVMRESAKAAITYTRNISKKYKIESDFYKTKDIHIHIPEGAIPKDGPSAGITLSTALVSALSSIKVKSNIAMTGEITLRGKVLPVGGIKEKVLAAHRAGITEIILPKDNKVDFDGIPNEVKEKIKFYFVSEMAEVLKISLVKE